MKPLRGWSSLIYNEPAGWAYLSPREGSFDVGLYVSLSMKGSEHTVLSVVEPKYRQAVHGVNLKQTYS